MHENTKIAAFKLDDSFQIGNIAITNNNESQKHLPIDINNELDLKNWILNRGVPITRQRVKVDLQMIKEKTPFELMIANCGLSLTDHYWLCKKDSSYTWETINLYTNDFKSTYSLDLGSDKRTIAGKTNFVPSASLKGDLKKKWIIDQNGIRRLVKGNYNNTCRQSLCEVLATYMHSKQNKVNFTPYSLIEISSDCQNIIGCECPNFTSINTEFIPAIDIVDSMKKPNEMSYYEFFIQQCYKNGLNIRKFLEYQIMTDFIISNTDRHFNNFGIIRDSNTLQWLSYAPIFDSGNSMFYKESYIPVDKSLLKIEVTSFLSREVKLLSYVTDRSLVDAKLLPSDNELYNLLCKDNNVKDEINQRLVKAYNKKIKYLIDFQNGANIWDYKYKG
jgi:hypothetical protein